MPHFPVFVDVPGLSPRVRENPQEVHDARLLKRSIPAGAGEPGGPHTSAALHGVYPRGCGGTLTTGYDMQTEIGLSPRVRGNRSYSREDIDLTRSIPAGAGEPHGRHRSYSPARVYPRGCGGTPRRSTTRGCSRGLSPRVRGNRIYSRGEAGGHRSIPAGAGEPAVGTSMITVSRVYPRGCGGTPSAESCE